MNILILGSGGREHAFAWKIKQSELCDDLYVAPGNSGTAMIAKNVAIGVNDFDKIKQLVLDKNIEMVVVGPEDPLVNGIHNFFLKDNTLCHPSREQGFFFLDQRTTYHRDLLFGIQV